MTPAREQFARAVAARYWSVPYWDPMLDGPYYVNLALACKSVEAEVEEHLMRKAQRRK
jgi:hypothetical protein